MSTNSTGAVGRETMECIIPYERGKQSCTSTTKFPYDEMTTETITEETTQAGDPKKTTVKKMITKTVRRTVTLRTFGQTVYEDAEDLFETFDKLQLEMGPTWTSVSGAQNRDAQVLFDAFSHCMIGVASSNWLEVCNKNADRTWKGFKTCVATFICTKVLGADAHAKQLRYMKQRTKPIRLSFTDWCLRMQVMNRYLPYMFPSLEALKERIPSATFSDLWKLGGLSDIDLKDLVQDRVPTKFYDRLDELDLKGNFRKDATIQEICTQYDKFQHLINKRQQPAVRVAGRRITYRGSANPIYYRSAPRPMSRQQHWSANQDRGAASPRTTYSTGATYQRPYFNPNQQQQQPQRQSFQRSPQYYSGRFGGQRSNQGGMPTRRYQQQYQQQQPAMRPQKQPIRSGAYFNDQYEATEAYFADTAESPQVETVEEFDQGEDQFAAMTEEEEQLVDEFNEGLFFDESIDASVPTQGDPSTTEDQFAFDEEPGECG